MIDNPTDRRLIICKSKSSSSRRGTRDGTALNERRRIPGKKKRKTNLNSNDGSDRRLLFCRIRIVKKIKEENTTFLSHWIRDTITLSLTLALSVITEAAVLFDGLAEMAGHLFLFQSLLRAVSFSFSFFFSFL